MKQCPKCHRSYPDDTLNFCLDDGSPLSFGADSEPTLVAASPTLSVRPRPTVSSRSETKPRSSLRWLFFAGAIVLAILLGGGVVAIIFSMKDSSSVQEKSRTSSSPQPTRSNGRIDSSPTPFPSQSATPLKPTIPNLSGEWRLVNTIEKTNFPDYRNLRLTYKITIKQTGSVFTAEGQKLYENDRELQPFEQTPIHLSGTIDENGASATSIEEGLRRKSSGRFNWSLTSGGNRLSGTFSSTAADSSGPSIATREP